MTDPAAHPDPPRRPYTPRGTMRDVFTSLVSCPGCGAEAGFRLGRKQDHGDAVSRYAACPCGERFKVIYERGEIL